MEATAVPIRIVIHHRVVLGDRDHRIVHQQSEVVIRAVSDYVAGHNTRGSVFVLHRDFDLIRKFVETQPMEEFVAVTLVVQSCFEPRSAGGCSECQDAMLEPLFRIHV